MEKIERLIDVGIVGGGPAGLNAALALGRARKSVVVIDEGRPRNRITRESHGFLTRDGIRPAEFRQIARAEISAYPSVRFVEDRVSAVSGTNGRFELTTAQGLVYPVKKLLFAAGMKDLPVDIEGLTDVYGKSAFVCPYCDGWELRDKPLVVIARGARGFHLAKMIAGWTSRYTICTNGPDELTEEQREELTEEQREELRQRNIPLVDTPIRRIASAEGMVQHVELADGARIACEGIFFTPKLAPGTELPRTVGCQVTETGAVVVDAYGKTNVPGIYSAGDAAAGEIYQLIVAASMGAVAGMSLNSELLTEAWNEQG